MMSIWCQKGYNSEGEYSLLDALSKGEQISVIKGYHSEEEYATP